MPNYSTPRKNLHNYYMFDILKRKSSIHLDCFTYIPEVYELFPLEYASKILPDWWKKLDTTIEYNGPKRGTMKTCPGVSDLFKSGYILPSWRDFYVEINSGIPRLQPDSEADVHSTLQWGEGLQGYAHLKLVSPWRIKEKTGANFLFSNSFWHNNETKFFVPNGMVEYKYQNTTNVNIVIQKKIYPNNFMINAGDPIVHCFPITDKKIKIHNHLISFDEYMRFTSYHFTFSGQYYKLKKIMQSKGK